MKRTYVTELNLLDNIETITIKNDSDYIVGVVQGKSDDPIVKEVFGQIQKAYTEGTMLDVRHDGNRIIYVTT